jgi:hypothetical protein
MKAIKIGSNYGTATVLSDNHSDKATNMERFVGNASLPACKGPLFDTQVGIRIHSYRTRLVDVDGVSAKYAIDGLVMGGIIANDTTKEVREVIYTQTKVKNKSQEKTEITIERV